MTPMPPRALSLKRNQALQDAMRDFLAAPIPPTALDTYLHCPLAFVWKHLCRFRPVQEVNEKDDPAEVGSVLHDVLQQLYRPYRNTTVDAASISTEDMRAELQRQTERHGLRALLPPDSLMMFAVAAPRRLEEYLRHQPEATILELEYPLTQTIRCNGREYTFKGRLDRLDRREDGLCIVDYKTGIINNPAGDLWDDAALFERMAQVRDERLPLEDRRRLAAGTFDQLAEKLRMIQLPCACCMPPVSGSCTTPPWWNCATRAGNTGCSAPARPGTMTNASVNASTSFPCCSGIWSTARSSPAVRAKAAAGAITRHFATPDGGSGLVKTGFFW